MIYHFLLNVINYLKVKFFDYEKSAFYLPWNSLKASLKKPVKSRHGRHRQLKNNPIIHVDIT
jgi:hypothetical protein